MIRYRRIQETDYVRVKKFVEDHKIEYDFRKPLIGMIAEADNEVIGVIFAHQVVLIEPFVCDKPLAAVKLSYMMEGALSAIGASAVVAAHVTENFADEIQKVGYEPIDSRYTMYKKVL